MASPFVVSGLGVPFQFPSPPFIRRLPAAFDYMRQPDTIESLPPGRLALAVERVMDLDQLHTFLEIVRLKSFSKAAQTCYRTQPAISAQVRQLEQELNTTLFERLGTKISLTTAGKIFAEYAEQILDLRRRAQDTINELDRVPRGELVIAANEATCIYVLPSVFSEYKKKFPNVQLSVDRVLRLARGGSGAGEPGRFRHHATAGTGKKAASGADSLR